MDARYSSVVVNGAQLAYVEQGQGEPLVFVHGTLSDFRTWDALMPPFGQRFRAIAISRRRHWPNAWSSDDIECEATQHAADLSSLIEALGLGPVHLVGSSYGALVALTMAAGRPDLTRTLVLGEPPLMPWLMATPEGRELFAAFSATAWEPAREAYQQGGQETGIRLFIDGVLGRGGFAQLPPTAREKLMENAASMGAELSTPPEKYFPALTHADVARIDTPALLMTGELSPRMFHQLTDELARCLPTAERKVIPGASHVMHAGNPQAYAEAVLSFVERRQSQRPARDSAKRPPDHEGAARDAFVSSSL